MDGRGLLGRDRDLDLEDLRPRGMLKKSCSFWRVPDGLGVAGAGGELRTTGGRLEALGVDGVMVVLVVLVVEDSGRDWMREGGLEGSLAVLGGRRDFGLGGGSGASFFDRERDRDLVRKL